MRVPVMRAVRLGPSGVEVQELRRPRPASGEVLVRVGAVLVDRRDAEPESGPVPVVPDAHGRRTLGRHVVGTVAAPGAGVDGWPLGRPVALQPERQVRRGWYLPGVTHEGGLAEYVVAPAEALVPLPPGTSLPVGAQIPLAGRVESMLRHGGVVPGSAVGIWGGGSLGGVAVAVARLLGAAPVVVVDPDVAARSRAAELGADAALDPGDRGLESTLAGLTSRRGLDAVLHAAPDPDAARQAVSSLGAAGRAVLAGPATGLGGWSRWDGRTLSGPPRTDPGALQRLSLLADRGRLTLPEQAHHDGGLATAAALLGSAMSEGTGLAPRLVLL